VAKIDAKEMVAALGVIGSLLFVGFEIRQNTEAVRGSTMQGIADQSLQFTLALSMDEDWLRLQERMVGDSVPPSQLSPLERRKLTWVLLSSSRIMENRFRQVQLGILDDDAIAQFGASRTWYGSWWYREWWDDYTPELQWAPDFIEFMETEMLAPSQR
jgi:hypothetical protein